MQLVLIIVEVVEQLLLQSNGWNKRAAVSQNAKYYYRLYQHSQNEDSLTRNVNPMELIHQLKFLLDKLISKYAERGLVDYISMATE